MNSIKKFITDFRKIYHVGKKVYFDEYFIKTAQLTTYENLKTPRRSQIINYFISLIDAENYLEIGVRDPKKNFNKIHCKTKFSVDPGVEFKDNPVDFKMTSDVFFEKLKSKELNLKPKIKFDVIFIDGLHISNQVDRDISHSFEFLSENGVIILHDCNPPSEFHQREQYNFINSPAKSFWNGTTWKAFYKARHRKDLYSICFDCDWGVAVISKKKYPLFNSIDGDIQNEFYEYSILEKSRKEHLNLCSFEKWKKIVEE